jgi:hypothetical protein
VGDKTQKSMALHLFAEEKAPRASPHCDRMKITTTQQLGKFI